MNRPPLSLLGLRKAVLLTAMAALLSACTATGTGLDLTPGSAVTVDTIGRNDPERRLAEAQNPAILAAYGGAYANPDLERTVAGIVGRLVAVSPDASQTYTIALLDSPQVNAFALPGGYLYITRGLLALANDASELAAVVAHEMAHVLARHGLARRQREQEVELAARVVSDVVTDRAAARAQLVRGRLKLAEFNRAQELEADSIGIDLLAKAGFDVYAAARFQQSMAAYTNYRSASGTGDVSLDFLASHPSAPRRVSAALEKARSYGPPGTGTRDRDRYLSGIDGMTFGDTPEEGFVRGNAYLHPLLGFTFSVPADFRIENTAEAVLATGPRDLAVRFDGASVDRTIALTDYLQSGWVSGLDASSVRPAIVNGLEAATARAESGQWAFDLTVIRIGETVYRMLVAAPLRSTELQSAAEAVRSSFRQLSDAEKRDLRPLKLRTVTVKPGDTIASVATRMEGTTNPLELFRVLNALERGQTLSVGQTVKIVSAQ